MDGVRSDVKVVESPRRVRVFDAFLRLFALAFTLVAAVVVGVSKETEIVPITITPSLPTLHLQFTAKWQYMSAFVYFLVSNAIACSYAAASLVYSLAVSSSFNQDAVVLVLSILDLVIMALLFSANGAAAAIGIIGRDGNSHVQWRKVCDMFGAFCHHFTAALVLSLIGSSAFLLLVAFAVLGLHKKPK
ncbi:hypothetical protein RGQ29_008091 [Quercus rubra]|uniref:CASP-like protein n=1 Tax=Quercus rubra TaxID=3512 RepID=A0AAN7DZA2_QUERU|nr:hypothetical protein RGQ29_008084 [Quercus rubra]KAK4558650.1 hypothetical protein RGQ29_008091 [Quercus rubra]